MRIIYLIIGFYHWPWLLLGLFYPCCLQHLFFCCLLLVSQRSSKRFEDWLYHTKLYQAYVADFRETKSIARERKRKNHRFDLHLDGNFHLF